MGDKYDLAYLNIDELPTSTVAPVSGDYRIYFDASANQWVKQDASTGDQVFDDVTIDALTVTSITGAMTATPGAITGTDSITQAEHANRVNVITGTSAATLTLPEATGTGDVYTFIFGQVNTNGTVFVAADTSNCSIGGSLNILDADANTQTAYFATSGDDTITINGTTTGGLIGDTIVLTDIATDQWAVSGQLVCPAGSNVADMFSSAA